MPSRNFTNYRNSYDEYDSGEYDDDFQPRRGDIARLKGMIRGKQMTPQESQYEDSTILSLDCEMVGTGRGGATSALARVSIVNYDGEVVFDTFVRPRKPVTDYRTFVSGVRAEDVWGPDAMNYHDVRAEVIDLLRGSLLVGHALQHDLQALGIGHPRYNRRDTQGNAILQRKYGDTPGLKALIQGEFGCKIQNGEHDSVEDARAAMALYRLYESTW